MFINQILTKLKSLVYSKSETDSLLSGKASSSHTHTKSQITDFPTIPSKTSQLTNDSFVNRGNNRNNIILTWSSPTTGYVNLKVDNTEMGGIITHNNLLNYGFITSAIKESSYGNNEKYCLLYGNLLIQFGTIVFTAQSGSVTFKTPFGSTPIVIVNYGDDVGYSSPCCLDEAYTTYFTVKQATASGDWRVNWVAIGTKG